MDSHDPLSAYRPSSVAEHLPLKPEIDPGQVSISRVIWTSLAGTIIAGGTLGLLTGLFFAVVSMGRLADFLDIISFVMVMPVIGVVLAVVAGLIIHLVAAVYFRFVRQMSGTSLSHARRLGGLLGALSGFAASLMTLYAAVVLAVPAAFLGFWGGYAAVRFWVK
ncbi:MAG: hypothetical protein AAF664_13210 [Planctomycetota bacterium]